MILPLLLAFVPGLDAPTPVVQELAAERRYLLIPTRTGAPKLRGRLVAVGEPKPLDEFDVEWDAAKPAAWMFVDVGACRGRKLRFELDGPPQKAALGIEQSDELRGAEPLYGERLRPLVHFTARRGWLNDPNGLVFDQGEWHLYFQHNPFGTEWGNMHWGHAVSADLFHWREEAEALAPAKHGDWAFSGSAVVDRGNASGFGAGALVAAFTSTGRGECIVYSTDRGRSFKEHAGNPVVKHQGRDPRLLWHGPTRQWAMAVYDEHAGKQWIAFHTSPDLKAWTFRSRIEGYFECPDLIELPLDGDPANTKWLLYAADGKYALGKFDGAAFAPDGPKHTLWHGNFYAAQTYSNTPGRCVQIGWGRDVRLPGMPFNQQMCVPCDLALRSTPAGPRLFAWPAKEIAALAAKAASAVRHPDRIDGLGSDAFDLSWKFPAGDGATAKLEVRGIEIKYDGSRGTLKCGAVEAPVAPLDGSVSLRVVADRASLEIFAQRGAVALSVAALPDPKNRTVRWQVDGAGAGAAPVAAPELTELTSAWNR